jgi:hypothetical protein
MRVVVRWTLLAVVALSGPARAADLKQVSRQIDREPDYRGEATYGLLVFGEEAKFRVWVVRDGDDIYVDANGNGDLTEPGEKFHKLARVPRLAAPGEAKYTSLLVKPHNDGLLVWVVIDGKFRQMAGVEDGDPLQLHSCPARAPVVHLDGPRGIRVVSDTHRLVTGEVNSFEAVVATPGLGKGTRTRWQSLDFPGGDLRARVEFFNPGQATPSGEGEVRLEAGCGAGYGEGLKLSDQVKPGEARITVDAPGWKARHVEPLILKFPVVAPRPKKG